MDKQINVGRIAKKVMSAQLASRASDPRFYAGLNVLPNPDPILRKLGVAEEVYDAISSDAHVMGELRSVRAGLLGYELKVVSGTEQKPEGKDQQALELCQQWMRQAPAPKMTWPDVIWNMATAIFKGRRAHELVWEQVGGQLLPTQLLDRPNRRFVFNNDNELRLLTRDNQIEGEEVPDYKFLLTRHMPSAENPYGQAVFASCYWPYTFKHGGFRFFYKFCERYGLPWPVGKYPQGSTITEQNQLLDALVQMTEDGAAVIPEGDSVEILTTSHSGELAQEALVHLCNREMSKALTSQTMATELRNVGSNAASQTANKRQEGVQLSDRSIISATLNEAFQWITLFNFGPDTVAPRSEFYKRKDVPKERAETWEIATRIGNPSLSAFHTEMNIPQAVDDADLMRAQPPASAPPSADFSAGGCPNCGQAHEFAGSEDEPLNRAAVAAVDQAIADDWIQPALDMLIQFEADGKTLLDFQAALPELYARLDDDQVTEITDQVMTLAAAQGMEGIGR